MFQHSFHPPVSEGIQDFEEWSQAIKRKLYLSGFAHHALTFSPYHIDDLSVPEEFRHQAGGVVREDGWVVHRRNDVAMHIILSSIRDVPITMLRVEGMVSAKEVYDSLAEQCGSKYPEVTSETCLEDNEGSWFTMLPQSHYEEQPIHNAPQPMGGAHSTMLAPSHNEEQPVLNAPQSTRRTTRSMEKQNSEGGAMPTPDTSLENIPAGLCCYRCFLALRGASGKGKEIARCGGEEWQYGFEEE
ncbi:hypothetical protein BDY21DRAFT_359891 [Lineolata rhizophorae]|uniref:Uncharacterized protein n=1 Tax=Lineolata rhizophorae TaxID=578093 RepID=A0A6A6PDC0_9PEZI|nr:hypothetical protein BDY21DRAFT_359891 [Lineolata rhizophorae]